MKGVLTTLMALFVSMPAAGAQERTQRDHTPYGQDSVAVNINPNRYEKKQPPKTDEGPRGTATRQNCGLSPREELLVSELRASLAQLERRRARVAAREAALRGLQARVHEDLAELRRLQGQVGRKLTKIQTNVSEYKAIQKEALRKQREQEHRVRELEEAERQRAESTRRIVEEQAEARQRVEATQRADQRRLAGQQKDSQQAKAAQDRQTRIAQLAGILKKMRPAQAAAILARQPPKVAVGVLEALGSRLAGKIMAVLSPEDSARLTRTLIDKPVDPTAEPPK